MTFVSKIFVWKHSNFLMHMFFNSRFCNSDFLCLLQLRGAKIPESEFKTLPNGLKLVYDNSCQILCFTCIDLTILFSWSCNFCIILMVCNLILVDFCSNFHLSKLIYLISSWCHLLWTFLLHCVYVCHVCINFYSSSFHHCKALWHVSFTVSLLCHLDKTSVNCSCISGIFKLVFCTSSWMKYFNQFSM